MITPVTIAGMRIIESSLVPEGMAFVVDMAAIERSMRSAWDRVSIWPPPPPTELDIIWRDCRRYIARSCPLIAPPEWAGIEDLAPERSWMSSMAGRRRVVLEPPKLLWWGTV